MLTAPPTLLTSKIFWQASKLCTMSWNHWSKRFTSDAKKWHSSRYLRSVVFGVFTLESPEGACSCHIFIDLISLQFFPSASNTALDIDWFIDVCVCVRWMCCQLSRVSVSLHGDKWMNRFNFVAALFIMAFDFVVRPHYNEIFHQLQLVFPSLPGFASTSCNRSEPTKVFAHWKWTEPRCSGDSLSAYD